MYEIKTRKELLLFHRYASQHPAAVASLLNVRIEQYMNTFATDSSPNKEQTLTVTANNHSLPAFEFRTSLKDWGRKNFRPFPWREARDPYRILMAEIMLHRTKAAQVVPVYTYFVRRYPDIASLAVATRDDLHAVLFSLGLRHRIDALHALANEVLLRFAGQVPLKTEDLLSLPGVSHYIAGAVRCFVIGEPEPLIDTNTVRVIGRLFGLEIKDSSRRNTLFKRLITALVDPAEPSAYNYALLDLAALVCTKTLPPACGECPVRRYCLYGIDPATKKRS